MVSGRTEKKASEALLAYAFCMADKIEILRFHGWGKYLNGMWHYAGKDEITMKEILEMNKEIITLLSSIKENFPIMREWKIVTDRILMLIVDNGKMGAAIRALSSDRSEIIREYMKISTIKEKLENTNSDFVFYPYEQTKRGRDFLDFLIAQVKAGEFSDLVMNAMLLVITEGIPLECDLDDAFFICLEGDSDSITDVGAVVPPDDQLTVVADQIRHIIKEQHSQEERFFLAAACFVYPYFAGMSCREGYTNLFLHGFNTPMLASF